MKSKDKKNIEYEKENIAKSGISLIVLVITIIVIIIIAGAVILNLTQNNPVNDAKKAKFMSDVDTFKSELSLYVANKQAGTLGAYNGEKLYADKESVTENGKKDTSRTIGDVITSIKNTKYVESIEIMGGSLVYVGDSKEETNWCSGIIEATEFGINVTTIPSDNGISGKITLKGSLVDASKIEWYKVYAKKVTDLEYKAKEDYKSTEKSSEISYNITGLEEDAEYMVKVEVKMEDETEARGKETEKVITYPDSTPPTPPNITVPSEVTSYDIEGITVTLKDNVGGSGINEEECKYIINQVSTTYDAENSIWESANKIENIVDGSANIKCNVESDGEYYLHMLIVDNEGNKTVAKSEKITVKAGSSSGSGGTGETTNEVIENPNTYYGKVVSNYTTGNSEVDAALKAEGIEWKIFYAGENPATHENNIYLIASNYVPNSTLPKQNKIKKDGKYKTNFESATLDYTGSANVTDSRIKGLNNDYFNVKRYTSDNNNMKAVAYMLDIEEWNNKYRNTMYADYVIGGPTIEILLKSYNQTHGTAYEYQASDSVGYQIRKTSTDSWENSNFMLDKSDSLYICDTTNTKAPAMWLTSTSYESSGYVFYIHYTGFLTQYYHYSSYAFRPVVCLRSDIKLESSGEGYILK